jgi:hypothetical protein
MTNKLAIATAAAAMLISNSAGAGAGTVTATSRALNACSKLNGAPYHSCLDKIQSCEAWIIKNSGRWKKGMTFRIDGGSEDPGKLCQHGGYCIPISAVRFKTSCLIVGQENENGTYYHWERAE